MKDNKESHIRRILSSSIGWDRSNESISQTVGCTPVYVAMIRRKCHPPHGNVMEQTEKILLEARDVSSNPEILAQALDNVGLLEIVLASLGERRVQQAIRKINERQGWQSPFRGAQNLANP